MARVSASSARRRILDDDDSAPRKRTRTPSARTGADQRVREGRGRRAAASDDDGDDDDDEVLQVGQASAAAAAADDDGRADAQTGPDLTRYARQVVRLALFAEASQGTLKRDDVNKKILGKDARQFGAVLVLAQRTLRKTFALELVGVRPRGKGADGLAAPAAAEAGRRGKGRKGKGKRRKGAEEGDEGGDDDDDDDDEGGEGEGQGGRMPSGQKKSTGPIRSYFLRSLLPQPLIAALALPLAPALPPACGEPLQGPVLALDKGAVGLAGLGVLYVVLALVLVGGRRVPDDHLKASLKTLGLHPTTRIPSAPSPTPGQPLALDGLLAWAVRHQYLERVRTGAGAAGEGEGEGGRAVWAWGARAEAEVSEVGVLGLIGEVYLPPADEGEGEGRLGAEKRRKERERLRRDVERAAGGPLTGDGPEMGE